MTLATLLALALVELENSPDPHDIEVLQRLRAGTPTPADSEHVVALMACLADEHHQLGQARDEPAVARATA
jgi:hypothetical protein